MIETFTDIYEKEIWGTNNATSYKGTSGHGSSIKYNLSTYIPFIKQFIIENNITTIVDLGCGDFRCGPYIYNKLNVTYHGYDAYNKVIEYINTHLINNNNKYTFTHLDFYNNKESIKSADVCILKDVLQHWSLQDIYNFLDYLTINKLFKYIIICNCSTDAKDDTNITTGDFRTLSANKFPLKKYSPQIIYTYDTKEVSVIKL